MQSRDLLSLDRHSTSMPFPSENFIYDEVGKMKKHTEITQNIFIKMLLVMLEK